MMRRGQTELGKLITGIPVLFGIVFIMALFVFSSSAVRVLKQPDKDFSVSSSVRDLDVLSESVQFQGDEILVLDGLLKYASLQRAVLSDGFPEYKRKEAERRHRESGIPRDAARNDIDLEFSRYKEFLAAVPTVLSVDTCLVVSLRGGSLSSAASPPPFSFTQGGPGGSRGFLGSKSLEVRKLYHDLSLSFPVSLEGAVFDFYVYSGACLL